MSFWTFHWSESLSVPPSFSSAVRVCFGGRWFGGGLPVLEDRGRRGLHTGRSRVCGNTVEQRRTSVPVHCWGRAKIYSLITEEQKVTGRSGASHLPHTSRTPPTPTQTHNRASVQPVIAVAQTTPEKSPSHQSIVTQPISTSESSPSSPSLRGRLDDDTRHSANQRRALTHRVSRSFWTVNLSVLNTSTPTWSKRGATGRMTTLGNQRRGPPLWLVVLVVLMHCCVGGRRRARDESHSPSDRARSHAGP